MLISVRNVEDFPMRFQCTNEPSVLGRTKIREANANWKMLKVLEVLWNYRILSLLVGSFNPSENYYGLFFGLLSVGMIIPNIWKVIKIHILTIYLWLTNINHVPVTTNQSWHRISGLGGPPVSSGPYCSEGFHRHRRELQGWSQQLQGPRRPAKRNMLQQWLVSDWWVIGVSQQCDLIPKHCVKKCVAMAIWQSFSPADTNFLRIWSTRPSKKRCNGFLSQASDGEKWQKPLDVFTMRQSLNLWDPILPLGKLGKLVITGKAAKLPSWHFDEYVQMHSAVSQRWQRCFALPRASPPAPGAKGKIHTTPTTSRENGRYRRYRV